MIQINKTIFQVDAFTDVPFKGNPAGVMFVDTSFSSAMMQHIASEMNLSETAFISGENNVYRIRYFTPLEEILLCGHATLSAAHIIFENKLVSEDETIVFKAKEDELLVSKENDAIKMVFPRYPLEKITLPENIDKIIGFTPEALFSSTYGWKIAVADSEEAIKTANPTSSRLIENDLGLLIITATAKEKKYDFVLRCFVPKMGIDEDPVTGSAHCALAPLWSERTGKETLHSLQLSKRTGELEVTLKNDKVEIKGKAITIFKIEYLNKH